jgi:hypothetical protein
LFAGGLEKPEESATCGRYAKREIDQRDATKRPLFDLDFLIAEDFDKHKEKRAAVSYDASL